VLRIGRARDGFVARIEGRGSVHESRTLREVVPKLLAQSPGARITVDLSTCKHLDSTFLGCLASLHRLLNAPGAARFYVVVPTRLATELFGSSGLERILPRSGFVEAVDWLAMPSATRLNSKELGYHLLECHRRLAEIGGPDAEAFTAVADQLERELAELHRSSGNGSIAPSDAGSRPLPTPPAYQRRAHPRVLYPVSARPELVVGGAHFSVIDLSVGGARVTPREGGLPDVGEEIEGALRFLDGAIVEISGRVLRTDVERNELVVTFESGVPSTRMRDERG